MTAMRLCPRCRKPCDTPWNKGDCPHCKQRTMASADLCLHPPDKIERVNKEKGWCHKCGEVLDKGEIFYFSERY